ncbi:M10 family metallopeptidase C-terminal domain-containing protein [Bradyrhizobium sp. 145]|nr:M10 family metallopeptidase C-terminal domain-containing protein [Bradyrhizobium sp. 145]
MSGGAGNDVVIGGEGADVINGDDGNDTLSGGTGSNNGTYLDDFNTAALNNSSGSVPLASSWVETGDSGGITAGQIRIDNGNNVLQFIGGTPAGNFDGAQIQRTVNLAGATAATLTYSIAETGLDAGDDSIQVWFSRDGTTFVLVDTINDATNNVPTRSINLASFGTGPFTAAAAVRFVASSLEAGDSVSIDNLTVNFTVPGLNAGADTVNGGAGDDTIVWNANAAAPTDGRDIVNGGTEGTAGDTFVINGNTSSETFNIYTLAAWDAVAGNDLASFGGRTPEIVITRNGTGFANVIAELSEIEEIRINSVEPAGTPTTTPVGAGPGDVFNVIGDFTSTSLRLNTITIDGDEGDDTIDISALTSAHRIVFKSNGGNDTIIGALQAEDVIELPAGADPATYHLVENQDGTKTVSNGTHSVTFSGVVPPQFQVDDEDEEETETPETPDDEEEETETPDTAVDGVVRTGTAQADTLVGTAGDDTIVALAGDDVAVGHAGADAISAGEGADFVTGGAGRDVIFAGSGDDTVFAGADADMVYGDAGADRIFGDQGDDMINAGAGDDTVFGGAGNDLIVAEIGDGNDAYFGDEGTGGSGIDTLDMSAATAAVTVNLGSGPMANGSATSSQTGSDTLWGIENVTTGSGNDVIVAGTAANVMNGGLGDDTFRFNSVEAAKGDTIVGFEPGDRIDLSGIDANYGADGNQSFTLVSDAAFTAAGQLAVTYETRNGEEFTVVQGNVDGNNAADFKIEIAGHQNLGANVTL